MSLDEAKDLIERLNLKTETAGSGSTVRAQKPIAGTYVKTREIIFLQLE